MTGSRSGVWLSVLFFAVGCQAHDPNTVVPPVDTPRVTPTPNQTPVLVEPEAEEEPSTAPSNSPVSLTASDGTGLKIVSFSAKAVVEDLLAFTELHIVFRNPEARQIEGQFEITLPTSATLSRFAMKQAWGWQEGEVVEKQAAREAYEDFLHRRQDPALLEKQPGNQFHARVFPIGASDTKEIILSYSEELVHTGVPYRVHLRGLPTLDKLDVTAMVSRRQKPASPNDAAKFVTESSELHRTHVQPDADFTVVIPAIAQQPQSGLRHEELVMARVRPVATEAQDPIERGLLVLFDTSASRALDFETQITRLSEVLAALDGKQVPLKVVCFDQDLETVYEGTVGGFDDEARAKIRARRALGASDLGGALTQLGKEAQGRWSRVLLVTDGIATAGAVDRAALDKRVVALQQIGVERLDAIVAGGIRDADKLAALVTAGLPRDGVVIDANKRAASIAKRLGRATISHLRVTVPGAEWSWPTELNGLQPGDEALVFASLPAGQPMTVDLDGPAGKAGAATHFSYPVPLTTVERALLERAVVNAHLHMLDAERAKSPEKAQAISARIVALSTKFRVLCDDTALLVLETEDDYARFHIDRRALSDILTVGQSGIQVVTRKNPALAQVEQVKQPANPQGNPQANNEMDKPKAEKKESSVTREAFKRKGKDDLDDLLNGAAASDTKVATGHLDLRGSGEGGGGTGTAMGRLARDGAPSGHANAATLGTAARPPAPTTPSPRMAPRDPGAVPSVEMAEARAERDEEAPRRQRLASPEPDAPPPPPPSTASSNAGADQPQVDPYAGKMKEVMTLLAQRKFDAAEKKAFAWRTSDQGDVLALIAVGEVAEKRGERKLAARAYGSIIDLFPGRADLRRFAGERLERVGESAQKLAIDTYKKAREERPDHPASHRLLAFAQVRAGDYADAFDTIVAGAKREYPDGRFLGVDRILREDAGLIGAVYLHKKPNARDKIEKALSSIGATLPTGRSTRFVLNWETDGNDVDFHIHDGQGGHAFFSHKDLASGGKLYADVTTGYGPECFTIEGEPTAYPYRLQAHYYSRGPMGYGMGKLEIIEHDGAGNLRFEERPFLIMSDNAFVDLGSIDGRLHASR